MKNRIYYEIQELNTFLIITTYKHEMENHLDKLEEYLVNHDI
ncbi:MAG: hypothetical protein ACTSXF_14615 [Promethearchaeota archaeon]